MDIQFTGSFLIGSLLLMTIFSMNLEIQDTNTMNFLNTTAQVTAIDIEEIIEYDFSRIGYSVPSGTNPIITFSDSLITFLADIDANESIDTISYYLSTTAAASGTDNPNDRLLYRNENGTEVDVALGITEWELAYFDRYGNSASLPEDILMVNVTFVVETMIGYDNVYGRAKMENKFVPKNLGLLL